MDSSQNNNNQSGFTDIKSNSLKSTNIWIDYYIFVIIYLNNFTACNHIGELNYFGCLNAFKLLKRPVNRLHICISLQVSVVSYVIARLSKICAGSERVFFSFLNLLYNKFKLQHVEKTQKSPAAGCLKLFNCLNFWFLTVQSWHEN